MPTINPLFPRRLRTHWRSSAEALHAPDDHPDLTEAGKKVAAAGRCASCHGEDFAGSKAAARIARQQEQYITKALHDYKSGVRSREEAWPPWRRSLSDDEISALAHYLARL